MAIVGQNDLGDWRRRTARHGAQVERGRTERNVISTRRGAARLRTRAWCGATARLRTDARRGHAGMLEAVILGDPIVGEAIGSLLSSISWISRKQVDLFPLGVRNPLDRIVARAGAILRLGRGGRAGIGRVPHRLSRRLAQEAECGRLSIEDRYRL